MRLLRFFNVFAITLFALLTVPGVRVDASSAGAFYLHDGDRVVFYGDSITAQRLYTVYVESYCVTRFPKRRFTFVHSGWGGDRVTGGGGGPIDVRLKRDVIAYRPTVVTICLGMNDGQYRAFDETVFTDYIRGYEHILDTLKRELPGVRITLLTASAYDDVTRPPGFPGGYNGTLISLGEAVKTLAQQYNCVLADTNAPLVATLMQARSHDTGLATKLIPDRVHPAPGGHVIMAAAVLKAWHAPDTVATFNLDAATRSMTTRGSGISNVRSGPDRISFRHTDQALPWPIDRDPDKNLDAQLVLASTDVERALNRYVLTVNGLTAPKWELREDGAAVATLTRDQLERGVDLAAIPAMPENVQARQVLALIFEHNNIHAKRWYQVQVPNSKNGEPVSAEVQRQIEALDSQELAIVNKIRAAVRPRPHALELVPAH